MPSLISKFLSFSMENDRKINLEICFDTCRNLRTIRICITIGIGACILVDKNGEDIDEKKIFLVI
jgi:hypothetical protein